jgi:hypothetical protein
MGNRLDAGSIFSPAYLSVRACFRKLAPENLLANSSSDRIKLTVFEFQFDPVSQQRRARERIKDPKLIAAL